MDRVFFITKECLCVYLLVVPLINVTTLSVDLHIELYVSPCGRHILFFPPCMCVRPSVRPFVCNAFLSEPDLQEPFVQKNCKKIPKITYLLKLCNEKLKFNFAKNFGSFGQKNTFWICVLSRPDLSNYTS